jgi:hypothetical protein
MVGGDGNFDSLTLSSSGGMPGPWNDGDQCNSGYNNVETVTSAPATITWDLCAWAWGGVPYNVISTGSRELTPTELATVRDALLQVKVSSRTLCGYDKWVVTLDVQAGGSVGRYVDDFYACRPAPDGRTFVIGTDGLEVALARLAQ